MATEYSVTPQKTAKLWTHEIPLEVKSCTRTPLLIISLPFFLQLHALAVFHRSGAKPQSSFEEVISFPGPEKTLPTAEIISINSCLLLVMLSMVP